MSEWWRTSVERIPRFARAVIVFFATEVFSNTLVDIVTANTNLIIDPTYSMTLNLSVATLVTAGFWVWDSGQASLKRLTMDFKELADTHAKTSSGAVEEVKTALLTQEIAQAYADLPSRVSEPLVVDYVDALKLEDRLEARARVVADVLSRRVQLNNKWYPILNRFLAGEVAGMQEGQLSLSLDTYLDIYLDLIRLYFDRAKRDGRRLHVWSFTNAIPSDWFAGDPHVSGNVMTKFANQKRKLIWRMRDEGFVMRMITLTGRSSGAPPGIRTAEDTVAAWKGLRDEQRQQYLTQLHTKPDDALLAFLDLEHLEFAGDLAEFIFFGLGANDNSDGPIDWDLCIAGGYSSQNQVLPARFHFLKESSNSSLALVDVPNHGKLKPPDEISAAARLRVLFHEWPDFVLGKRAYGAIKVEAYANMISFAEKWCVAAEIWHHDRERREIAAFLDQALQGKSDIMDAAAGTGFHCEILLQLGKEVTALEVSADERDLLNARISNPRLHAVLGDWRTLPADLNGQKFEGIICLGSSIPYHSSWTDQSDVGYEGSLGGADAHPKVGNDEMNRVLREVVSNLQIALVEDGVLVIGLSRHNEKSRSGVSVSFEGTVDGVTHNMSWSFQFDWHARTRLWHSQIEGDDGRRYNFEVMGHLFDHADLIAICKDYFHSVEERDLGDDHYDKYILCNKPR